MRKARRASWWLGVALCSLGTPYAHAHGDLHEQIAAITKRLQAEPKNAELYHRRGELERAHRDYDAALRDYERAGELDPSLDVIFLSRGRAWLEAGKPGLSCESLSLFLEHHPTHSWGLLLRARARTQLGERSAAEVDFARALAQSEDPAPDLFLERADNLSAAQRKAEALQVLEAGIARVGAIVTLHEAALELEIALGRYEAALARIDGMLRPMIRTERWLARKADVLDAAGRSEESRGVRLEALRVITGLPLAKRSVPAMKALEAQLLAATSH